MSGVARHPHLVLAGVCWAAYLTAFFLPALQPRNENRPHTPNLFTRPDLPQRMRSEWKETYDFLVPSGDHNDLSGTDAFDLAWILRDESWRANPAFWLATVFLVWRMWAVAAVAATLACGIALSECRGAVSNLLYGPGLHGNDYYHGSGFWLWCGSMALMATVALAGCCGGVRRESRRSPAEVFTGLRGVVLGCWLAVGLGVVVGWWNVPRLHPSPLWRLGLVVIWVGIGLAAGAAEWHGGRKSWGWKWVAAGGTTAAGAFALAAWYCWGDILLPPPPR